jgi:uncharacterized protein (UPF0332 family)
MITKGQEKLATAKLLLDNSKWDDAASRAYYAAFHAVSAVLFQHDLQFKSHGQVIGAFNKNFIKTGIFSKDWGARLRKMMEDREAGDYRAKSEIGDQIAREDVQFAEEILKACKEYLKVE